MPWSCGSHDCCTGAPRSPPQAVDPRGRPSATATAAVQRAYGRAVRERRNFELKVVYSRGGGKTEDGGGAGNGGSGGGGERSGLVEFRFAPNTGVDEHMQLIGIPNFLPDAAEPPSYYFALLRELGPAAAAPPGGAPPSPAPPRRPSVDAGAAPPALAPAASGPFASRLGTGDSGSGTASSNYLGDAYKLLPNNDVFADIRLGPLLGKGSFGRVYRGGRPPALAPRAPASRAPASPPSRAARARLGGGPRLLSASPPAA